MARKTLGGALNGVAEPHRRESHVGRVSTVGSGGKSVAVTNMNNSQLTNLVPITPYGISSSPPVGLMAYVLVADNASKNGIVGVYDPNKPSCNPGNCMMYSSGGATVHCSGASLHLTGSPILFNSRNLLNEVSKNREDININRGDIDTNISDIAMIKQEIADIKSKL